MPELPEVETVRRGLVPVLAGKVIRQCILRRPGLRYPFDDGLRHIAGQTVQALERRSKYLLLRFTSGDLVVHLGMSGRFHVRSGAPAVHDHVVWQTDTAQILYHDPRRFGFMRWQDNGQPLAALASLALDPWPQPLPDGYLARAFHGRRQAVKVLLLDQTLVGGIGNIYACEALFAARIDPRCPGGALSASQIQTLADALHHVLARAVTAGGSSVKDHQAPDGSLGYFQHQFSVYGRAGQPCCICATPLTRIVQAGRATFFCDCCQC